MRLLPCACHPDLGVFAAAPCAPANEGGGGKPPPASAGPLDATLLADLATGNRILAAEGVFDAYGHLSLRHPAAPDRFWMSRSMAPALVTVEDMMEFDLDGEACDPQGRRVFLERFIHGEIYRRRPDVQAVVHSHSPSVIPFGLVQKPMQAMYHNAAFLAEGVPVFDIAEKFGVTDMLVSDSAKGAALAEVLADKAVALMRGHGSVAVAESLEMAVFRAVMTEVNAKLQTQAHILAAGGPVAALSVAEGRMADSVNVATVSRPWELWKRRHQT